MRSYTPISIQNDLIAICRGFLLEQLYSLVSVADMQQTLPCVCKVFLLTAPSMMRTMSHLKVQMQMREGGQRRGTWDRVHTGHRKMARKPVSNS